MISNIIRQPSRAATEKYDLIVIGGGIYGALTTLVASQAGLKTLLLEKEDYGAATSYNSLRTLHGGLRYLQKMDLHRFFESVAERRWFLRNFPDLTSPLPCLMPLYGEGVYRTSVFRVALFLNDALSHHRNQGMPSIQTLPKSRVLNREEVIRHFPKVVQESLKGGAFWFDGAIPATQLVIIQILKWASFLGAVMLNYVEAQALLQTDNAVRGVLGVDRETGESHRFYADRVVNAAGPWCRELAAHFDKDHPELFRCSIAWNALLNKKALSNYALAVKPKKPNSRVYFLHSWNGRVLAGTVHSARNQEDKDLHPTDNEIRSFVNDLNHAIPSFNLTIRHIQKFYIGLLPARKQGSADLAVREVLLDHGRKGGPSGLYSVSGVKFTTARRVAVKLLSLIFPDKIKLIERTQTETRPSTMLENPGQFDFHWRPGDRDNWKTTLEKMIEDEAVVHLDDLILRRTTLGDNPDRAMEIASSVSKLFGWEQSKRQNEVKRLRCYYQQRKPLI